MDKAEAKNSRNSLKGIVLAVIAVLIIFIGIEIVLRIINYGDPFTRNDPFYGFEGANPVYRKLDIKGKEGMYVPSPNKSELIEDQKFSVNKSSDTYRIFTFGGSTTHGVPYGIKGSFSNWLGQDLQQLSQDVNVEVINVGISGWGSKRVLQVIKEVVDYSPDLFIIYTGQNEFRDASFHPKEVSRTHFKARLLKLLLSSRVIYLIYERSLLVKEKIFGYRSTSYVGEAIDRITRNPFTEDTFASYEYYRVPAINTTESNSCADFKVSFEGGITIKIKNFIKNLLGCQNWNRLKGILLPKEISEKEIYSYFRNNILQMIHISKKNSVPIIFLAKARNPKTMYARRNYTIDKAALREGSEDQWRSHYNKGVAMMKRGNFSEALKHFEKVRSFYKPSYDTDDKLLSLYTGECYENLGFYDLAKLEYNKRFDIEHIRLRQILKDTAMQYIVPVIDIEALFIKNAKHGIVGYDNYFADGLHMTLCGNKLISNDLAFLIKEKYVKKHIGIMQISETPDSYDCQLDEKLPEQFESVDVYTSLGWSAFNQGRIEKALAMGKMAVSLDPSAPQAHMLLGYVYAQMQHYQDEYDTWETLKKIWTERLN